MISIPTSSDLSAIRGGISCASICSGRATVLITAGLGSVASAAVKEVDYPEVKFTVNAASTLDAVFETMRAAFADAVAKNDPEARRRPTGMPTAPRTRSRIAATQGPSQPTQFRSTSPWFFNLWKVGGLVGLDLAS